MKHKSTLILIIFILFFLIIDFTYSLAPNPIVSSTAMQPSALAIPHASSINLANTLTFTNVTTNVFGFMPSSTISNTMGVWIMTPGAAAGDFNNDGWEDLFFLGGENSTDALFVNNQDGTFTDQAAV